MVHKHASSIRPHLAALPKAWQSQIAIMITNQIRGEVLGTFTKPPKVVKGPRYGSRAEYIRQYVSLTCRDYTALGASLPASDNPNDPLLNLQAPINIGDPSESNVLLAQVRISCILRDILSCSLASSYPGVMPKLFSFTIAYCAWICFCLHQGGKHTY